MLTSSVEAFRPSETGGFFEAYRSIVSAGDPIEVGQSGVRQGRRGTVASNHAPLGTEVTAVRAVGRLTGRIPLP
jgi:hypothetical protein